MTNPPRWSNRSVLFALLGLLAVLFVASYCFIWWPHSNPLPGRSGSATAPYLASVASAASA